MSMWLIRGGTGLVKAKDNEILQTTGDELKTFYILTAARTNKLNASKVRTRLSQACGAP